MVWWSFGHIDGHIYYVVNHITRYIMYHTIGWIPLPYMAHICFYAILSIFQSFVIIFSVFAMCFLFDANVLHHRIFGRLFAIRLVLLSFQLHTTKITYIWFWFKTNDMKFEWRAHSLMTTEAPTLNKRNSGCNAVQHITFNINK